jgi:hypothetical protein
MQPFCLFLVLSCLVLFGSERVSSEVALVGRGSFFLSLTSLWLSSIFNRPAHRYDPAMEFIQSSLVLSIQPSIARARLRACVPDRLFRESRRAHACRYHPQSFSPFRKRANQSSHDLLPESIHHFLNLPLFISHTSWKVSLSETLVSRRNIRETSRSNGRVKAKGGYATGYLPPNHHQPGKQRAAKAWKKAKG